MTAVERKKASGSNELETLALNAEQCLLGIGAQRESSRLPAVLPRCKPHD